MNATVKDVFKKRKFSMLVGNTGDIYGVARDDGIWMTLTSENFKDIRPRIGSRINIITDKDQVSATVIKF
jgi:hypothetical protein